MGDEHLIDQPPESLCRHVSDQVKYPTSEGDTRSLISTSVAGEHLCIDQVGCKHLLYPNTALSGTLTFQDEDSHRQIPGNTV